MGSGRIFLPMGFVLAIVMAASIIGCGGGVHGALTLYDSPSGERLPGESVARIVMDEAIQYGVSIVRFDDQRGIGARDTVEILPGNHQMWLYLPLREPAGPRLTGTTHSDLHVNYLYFEFEAEAGQMYELKVTGFTPPEWSADLVDRATPPSAVRGILTTSYE